MGLMKRLALPVVAVVLTLSVAVPYGLAARSPEDAPDRAPSHTIGLIDTGAATGDSDAVRVEQAGRRHRPRARARLRVLHASPDTGALDVQVRPIPDGEWTTVATDIGFGEASRYVKLDPGTHDVQLLAAGSDDLVHVVADVVGDAALQADRARHRPGHPGRGSARRAYPRPPRRT